MIGQEIIYVLPDDDLGVASIIRNLLKYRPESNLYYKVILTHQIERESISIKDEFNVNEQITFNYSKKENLYAVCRRLKKYISNIRSILVANDGLELRMVQLLKLENPVVYILHGDFDFYYRLINQNQGVIDKYIAYSLFTQMQLTNKLDSVNKEKVKLVYYPVPRSKKFKDSSKNNDLLFAGAFVERKGVQFLKTIFQQTKKECQNVSMRIVGSGKFENRLKNEFRDEKNVVFTGHLKNSMVIEEMQNSKILLFPSLSEGLPNVVVEAMKAKCIPLCSDIPSGIPDLVVDGETGYKFLIGDTESFANKACVLLKDESLRKSIGEKASKKAEFMFSPELNAKKYEEEILSTIVIKKTYLNKTMGGILNQSFLPNRIVKTIRKLNLSKHL